MTKAAELAKMGEVLTNSQIGGRRNIVINGGMNVAQRSSSAVTGIGASDGYFTCDRWNFNTNGNSAGRLTMSQASDGPSGFANCLKLECTTADTSIAAAERFFIEQKLEGQDVQQLKKGTSDAEKVTISFYVKGHDSATYTVGLYEGTSGRKIAATFPVTTSWVRQTVTFDGDTSGAIPNDNTAQLHLRFYLHAGSNYTSGTLGTSWNADGNTTQISSDGNSFFESTSATFFLTGVQLELGSQATPFEHRSFGEELSLCQRYYTREGAGSGGVYKRLADGICGTTTFADFMVNLSTPLRATPTLETSGNVNHYVMYSANALDVVTALALNNDSDDGTFNHSVSFYGTVGSGLVAGDSVQLLTNANASYYLALDAEL